MGYETICLHKPFIIDRIVSIHYFEYTSTYAFEGERHDFWELLYVDKGAVLVHADDREHTLQKGQIIFHKPGEFHSLRSCGGTAPNLVVAGFVCTSPHMRFFEGRIEELGSTGRALLAAIVSEAAAAFSSHLGDPQVLRLERRANAPFGCEQLIACSLEQLLLRLVRRAHRMKDTPQAAPLLHNHTPRDFVTGITRYLQANLHRKLSLSDICRDNLVGRSYLQKIFRERTGGGVMEYFGTLKIEAAKEKIREGCLNFTEIASLLGYSSIHYFSRHFKKNTGMTPSEYASSVKSLSGKAPSDEPL